MPLMSALTILDPAKVEQPDDADNMATHGQGKLEELLNHFRDVIDHREAEEEWEHLKVQMTGAYRDFGYEEFL